MLVTQPILAETTIVLSVNGVTSSATPFMDRYGAVMLPLRTVSDIFGAKVTWNGTSRVATVSYNKNKLIIPLDETYYFYNGKKIIKNISIMLVDNSLYIPLTAIVNIFKMSFYWGYQDDILYLSTYTPKEAPPKWLTDELNSTFKPGEYTRIFIGRDYGGLTIQECIEKAKDKIKDGKFYTTFENVYVDNHFNIYVYGVLESKDGSRSPKTIILNKEDFEFDKY